MWTVSTVALFPLGRDLGCSQLHGCCYCPALFSPKDVKNFEHGTKTSECSRKACETAVGKPCHYLVHNDFKPGDIYTLNPDAKSFNVPGREAS